MAKPIRATPHLNTSETKAFLSEMIRFEKAGISKVDKEIKSWIEKNGKYFSAC
jgi:hypothetical protein